MVSSSPGFRITATLFARLCSALLTLIRHSATPHRSSTPSSRGLRRARPLSLPSNFENAGMTTNHSVLTIEGDISYTDFQTCTRRVSGIGQFLCPTMCTRSSRGQFFTSAVCFRGWLSNAPTHRDTFKPYPTSMHGNRHAAVACQYEGTCRE